MLLFRLEGHTDSMGAEEFNYRLSKDRVMARSRFT